MPSESGRICIDRSIPRLATESVWCGGGLVIGRRPQRASGSGSSVQDDGTNYFGGRKCATIFTAVRYPYRDTGPIIPFLSQESAPTERTDDAAFLEQLIGLVGPDDGGSSVPTDQ